MIRTHTNAHPSVQHEGENSSPRDASFELFQELYEYKGRVLLPTNGSPLAPATEAVFLCQILFLQFLTHRAPARKNATLILSRHSPQTFYRDALAPLLQKWFPTFENDAVELDARLLYELMESFDRHHWDLSADSIRPWLLGYVYERWINQRESGSYFTPDLLAYNIAQLAIHSWLATQAEIDTGIVTELREALRNRGIISSRAREWLCTQLDTVRIVDLSMGGGIPRCGNTGFV